MRSRARTRDVSITRLGFTCFHLEGCRRLRAGRGCRVAAALADVRVRAPAVSERYDTAVAHPAPHAADDSAQHAVSRDGVPDRLSAPARARVGCTSRRPIRRSSCSCACSRATGSKRSRRARSREATGRRPPPSIAGFLAHARRYIDNGRRGRALLTGARSGARAAHRGARVLARGAAVRRDRRRGDARRSSAGRSARSASRIARSTSRASTSTTSPTSMRDGIEPRFELSRYGERLGRERADVRRRSPPRSTAADARRRRCSTRSRASSGAEHQPDLVGLTVPFPGNVYGALRIARAIKRHAPRRAIALGGGYVNTELRELADPRVFDYVDYITLDDGERRCSRCIEHLRRSARPLVAHVRARGGQRVERAPTRAPRHAVARRRHADLRGLPLDRYLSLFEMLNPMHRLWSEAAGTSSPIAHGCYWKKCTFCDVTLDYIARYDPVARRSARRSDRSAHRRDRPDRLSLRRRGGAAGRAARARRAADRARRRTITWWGNIRFEKTFTPELAQLLARSGCVARLAAGSRSRRDRLLELMKKGVTVEQVARVTRAFTDAGIMVHAYLMYGFPTRDRAGDDRLARARAPAVRRRLLAIGVLASLRGDRAQPDRPAARALRHPLAPRAGGRRSRGTTWRSTIRPASITTRSARACARRSTTTCTASGSTPMSAAGSPRKAKVRRRRWRSHPRSECDQQYDKSRAASTVRRARRSKRLPTSRRSAARMARD